MQKKTWRGILQAGSWEAALQHLQQTPYIPFPGWIKADNTCAEVHIHRAQVQQRQHFTIPAPGCLIKCDHVLHQVPAVQLQEMKDCLAFEHLTF